MLKTVRLENPLIIYGAKRYHILEEDSFVEYVINRKLTRDELVAMGVAANTYTSSIVYYRDKYKIELAKLKSERYSRALTGNTHGTKNQPDVLLDKERLSELVELGHPLESIANTLNTTMWFVKANMRYYNIKYVGKANRICQDNEEIFVMLEKLTPGILELARNVSNEPFEFFNALYISNLKLLEVLWFIQKQSNSLSYYTDSKGLDRKHITYSLNKGEAKLGKALIYNDIPHRRIFYPFTNNQITYDFFIENTNLLIEVDGSIHKIPTRKTKDKYKDKLAQEAGYQVLRVSIDDVDKRIQWILTQIRNSIQQK